ncbi:uncharacterized protein FIBRA_00647 [Fibroporia radiculosa]|uniref:Protein kinase domain-containing protein n=1 Tax=Fibroporia radiculosa TaxID=599839 RepID=J4GI92_9APHY|nr:uncharacterized protein FIBRA_00647 [Fibroporia radiculosa]CCL98645.1 predicted protein [Fibroporia radiculosa]
MADDGPSGSGPPHVWQTGAQTLAPSPHSNPTDEVVMTHEIRSSFNHQFNRKMINQYEFDHRVGRGQHGEVYLARDTSKGSVLVAVKGVRRKNKQDRLNKLRKRNIPSTPHLPLTDQLGSTEHKIRKEIAIMKKCRHPHVVRLLEVIDEPLGEKIWMVMEYLGGGEIKWRTMGDEPVLRVDQTRRICRDVILGLEYLHHQGIIHRDIKPANLLWTADRRTVKITDFGVSHFSYAQRLAAAGAGTLSANDTDPILMDDSDLSRTAGTPMFLAPEIVSDTSGDMLSSAASSSSTTIQSPISRRKPPITKAIDVWAFGVTLYGLLFGHLPFQANTEYEVYQVIRRQDWDVDPTMGSDKLPTGGRHQKPLPKGQETEGYLVVKLLERLLEKDAKRRITLDEVKRHPWILRDMANSQQWLRETQLDRHESLEPTADETSSAMSAVRFRWSARLTHRISHILRNVRPQRSFFSNASRDNDDKHVGVQSAPHISLSRHRTTTGVPQRPHSRDRDRGREPRDKGKQRLQQRIDVSRNKSTTDVSARSLKGFEPWAAWASASASTSAQGSVPKQRRGSLSSRTAGMTLEVPSGPSRVGSPQPSPVSYSQASTPSGEGSGAQSPDDRPRSRLSLSTWMRWRRPVPVLAQDPTSSVSVRRSRSGRLSRRSEDAFNVALPSRQSTAEGSLTFAMRAASWGDVPGHAYPPEDLASIYSGERFEDMLDDDTLLLGAGGVAQSPIPSIRSSGMLSTVSSMSSLSPVTSGPAISAAHAILQRSEVGELASTPDPAVQNAAALARHGHSRSRSRTTSPLAQISYNSESSNIHDVVRGEPKDYDSSSSVDHDSRSSILSYNEVEYQPSTSQRYREEDNESDDEDQVRLEVRPRRPSASRSPTRKSETPHRERPMICI